MQVYLIESDMLVGGYGLSKELVANAAFNALQDFLNARQDFHNKIYERQEKKPTPAKAQYLKRIRFVDKNGLATLAFVNVFKRRMLLLTYRDRIYLPNQLMKFSVSANDIKLSEQYVFHNIH